MFSNFSIQDAYVDKKFHNKGEITLPIINKFLISTPRDMLTCRIIIIMLYVINILKMQTIKTVTNRNLYIKLLQSLVNCLIIYTKLCKLTCFCIPL